MPYRADLDPLEYPDCWPALKPGEWCFDAAGALVANLPCDTPFATSHPTRPIAWGLSGTKEKPTVTPSIKVSTRTRELPDGTMLPAGRGRDVVEWHGFLTEGQWRPCADSPDYPKGATPALTP